MPTLVLALNYIFVNCIYIRISDTPNIHTYIQYIFLTRPFFILFWHKNTLTSPPSVSTKCEAEMLFLLPLRMFFYYFTSTAAIVTRESYDELPTDNGVISPRLTYLYLCCTATKTVTRHMSLSRTQNWLQYLLHRKLTQIFDIIVLSCFTH